MSDLFECPKEALIGMLLNLQSEIKKSNLREEAYREFCNSLFFDVPIGHTGLANMRKKLRKIGGGKYYDTFKKSVNQEGFEQ